MTVDLKSISKYLSKETLVAILVDLATQVDKDHFWDDVSSHPDVLEPPRPHGPNLAR